MFSLKWHLVECLAWLRAHIVHFRLVFFFFFFLESIRLFHEGSLSWLPLEVAQNIHSK